MTRAELRIGQLIPALVFCACAVLGWLSGRDAVASACVQYQILWVMERQSVDGPEPARTVAAEQWPVLSYLGSWGGKNKSGFVEFGGPDRADVVSYTRETEGHGDGSVAR